MTNRRLLAIDDDAGFRGFLTNFLNTTDLESVVTGDADAFKAAYAGLYPGYIFIDIVMPDIDGLELLQWLAEQGSKASILVITGYNPTYAEMAATMGVGRGLENITSLTKPISLAELRTALDVRQPEN
jgi:DNA-binding NtrC family response regulator